MRIVKALKVKNWLLQVLEAPSFEHKSEEPRVSKRMLSTNSLANVRPEGTRVLRAIFASSARQ